MIRNNQRFHVRLFKFRQIRVVGLMFVVLGLQISCTDSGPAGESNTAVSTPRMEVFKKASCDCCGKWIEHVESAGFKVKARNRVNMNTIKREFNIAPQYQSCHTAVYEGYVFEGHIPIDVIHQFVENPPGDAVGLSVPGMPVGSPGMEIGDRLDEYDVLLLKSDGSSEIYAHIEAP
jgi:hypothetical protein